MSTTQNVQIMLMKRGKWYCYFCGEEITSLDKKHYERCEIKDVNFKDKGSTTLEVVTFIFKWKFKWKSKKEKAKVSKDDKK